MYSFLFFFGMIESMASAIHSLFILCYVSYEFIAKLECFQW